MAELVQRQDEYPLWSIAVANILERFENEGYGAKFAHDELKAWMGIRRAESMEDVDREKLDYLIGIRRVWNNLLDNYNLFISNVIGFGYEILHPKDQIRKGADYYQRKSQTALTSAVRVVTNLDISELDDSDRQLQISKMNRIAFVKAAFRKRKLPVSEIKKQIE
jgi:hypothetical protein